MQYMKRILVGLFVSLLIMLPAIGYVADSTDNQPATTQSDANVKAEDEKAQDTQQQPAQQDQETQNQESDSQAPAKE